MEGLTVREIFPIKLKYYMRENGKRRNDLVNDLGFPYSTVRDWVKGITVPSMDKVELLAEYFGCNNSDLIEEKKEKPIADDGLTENQRMLIDFAKSLNEDQCALALRLLKSLAEAD